MKQIIYVIGIAFFSLLHCSCEEYAMVEYGEGGEIHFMGDYYRGENKKPYWVDDVKYLNYERNFGINPLGDSLLYDTINIGVKIMGIKKDVARRVVFATEPPKENALEVIFPDEYVVPADTGRAVFRIVVKRPATRDTTWSTKLVFDYAQSDFKAGTIERQVFELKARDEVSMYTWGVTDEEWYAEMGASLFFGEFSEAKARFMITLLGCHEYNKWYDSDEFWDAIYDNVLFNALQEYRSNPVNPPLLDDRGEWISFPDIFELM